MPLTRVTGNIVKEATLPESKLINPYVNVSGDTMTGTLYLANNGLIAGTNQLVLSGGNVGVKNLSPSYTLDVTGDIRASGQLITNSLLNVPAVSISSDGTAGSPAVYFGNDTNTGIYRTSTGTVSFSSSGNLSLSVNATRLYNVSGILSNFRTGSINSTDNSLEYSSGTDTLFVGRDANTINLRTNNTQNRIVINNVGQVSIGTANTVSGVLLNVAGKINATGGYSGIVVTDLPVATITQGGTGITTYSAGDILYYTSGTTLTKLASPASQSLLSINNNVPAWINLPISVSFGGTGSSVVPTNGQILIGDGTRFVSANVTSGTGITIINGSGTLGIGVTNIPNSSLANSSVTVNTGNGLAGGGSVALGGTLNLTNAGVTAITAGSGITISGATGNVTVSNSGVRTATGSNGVSVSSSTGAVTFSLNSSFSPTFAGLTLTSPLSVTNGGTGLTTATTSNQILYANGTGGYIQLTLIGNGVTISPDFNTRTLTLSATPGGGGFADKITNGNTSVSIPASNGDIIATTGNIETLRINNQQNIGVGTTIPAFKIDFGTAYNANSAVRTKLIGLTTQPGSGFFSGFGRTFTGAGVLVAGSAISVAFPGIISDFGYYSTDGLYTWSSTFSIYNDGTYGVGAGTTAGTGTTASPNGASFKVTDTTTTSTTQVPIDTYSSTTYRSAKYLVQIRNTDNNRFQTTEILLTHDGTNVYMTEYATILSGDNLGVIDADIVFNNVRLLLTPTYNNNRIRVYRTILGTMN